MANDNSSVFYSEYIIDGVKSSCTPGQMLNEAMIYNTSSNEGEQGCYGTIIDETTEKSPLPLKYPQNPDEYIGTITGKALQPRAFKLTHPEVFTKQRIAVAILDTLWKKGHFRLDNLSVELTWEWVQAPVGHMAAFYNSAKAAAEYIYNLDIDLHSYKFEQASDKCTMKVSPGPLMEADENDRENLSLENGRQCPASLQNDKNSTIIYIPFDPCGFELGGSLLEDCIDNGRGRTPEINDPDYCIDCFEVARELVEDGIIMAGRTVCDGGLAAAAGLMTGKAGLDMNISGIQRAYKENDVFRILFAEIPGILIQIRDCDYDYFDGQMLLQDVAYYPVGHINPNHKGLHILKDCEPGIADILAALMQGASEGED